MSYTEKLGKILGFIVLFIVIAPFVVAMSGLGTLFARDIWTDIFTENYVPFEKKGSSVDK